MSTTPAPCKHEIDELLAQLSNQHLCEHCGVRLRTSLFPPGLGEEHKTDCPNRPRIEYVVGFLFDAERAHVLLLQKNRPEWQRGMWNGPGGKLEPGETAAAAMRREYLEETDKDIADWEQYAELSGLGFQVFFFRSFCGNTNPWPSSMTDERVEWFSLENLPTMLPNADWLIPMALSLERDRAKGFTVQEVAA